jgi:hypothetical protein
MGIGGTQYGYGGNSVTIMPSAFFTTKGEFPKAKIDRFMMLDHEFAHATQGNDILKTIETGNTNYSLVPNSPSTGFNTSQDEIFNSRFKKPIITNPPPTGQTSPQTGHTDLTHFFFEGHSLNNEALKVYKKLF